MVNTAQSHHQPGENKLLGKFRTIASSSSLNLLTRAIPTATQLPTPSMSAKVNNLDTERKMSILHKMRQSFIVSSANPAQLGTTAPQAIIQASPTITQQPVAERVVSSQPITQLDALNVLDQVITEVENNPDASSQPTVLNGSLAQALPQATQQAVAASQPQVGGRALAKESTLTSIGLDQIAGDMAGGAGPSEVEPPKELEIPVEVESYLQKVEDHKDQLPQEIVVADNGTTISTRPYPKQPVIVLPVTAEIEKVGATKSPVYSIRWLVEWSRKIMKMFEGMVIYRQDVIN